MADLFDIAIAKKLSGGGGGGGSDFEAINVVFEGIVGLTGVEATYDDLLAMVNNGKTPYYEFTDEQAEGMAEADNPVPANTKYVLSAMYYNGDYCAIFSPLLCIGEGERWGQRFMAGSDDDYLIYD